MKKKSIFILLAVLLCVMCVALLTACGKAVAPEGEDPDTEQTPGGGDETPAHTHVFGEWIVTTPATCVTKGIQTRACDCGHSETQYIAIDTTAHSADTEWKTDGTHHWKACTRTGCDAQLNKGTHGYGSWRETLAPTCVAKGSHYKTCTTCTKKVTEDIPVDPTAHKAGTEWKTDGTHHWKACTRTGCDARVNEAAHTPAAAWSSDATNHWHDCTACGYDINLIAHTYDAENTCACQHYKDAGVKFTLKNGTYAVTDYTGTATEVIIPSKYKGIAVTAIGNWAFGDCDSLQSITIPAGVTAIGDYAFFYCTGLQTVTFGANSQLTAIGSYAFSSCSGLQSITIPASVTAIGNHAFYDCSSLQTVTFGENSQLTTIGNHAFYDCSSLQTVTFGENSQLTTIGEYAFAYCSGLQSVTFGENSQLTAIGNHAFFYCTGLQTVTFGENSQLTAIGDEAFYNCRNLQSITIPASVTTIGYGAFSGCSSLQSITIPAGVTTIGKYAFAGCSKLTSVTFGNPDGWWVASSSTATSGTAISATNLAKTDTAADYLTSTYRDYYWKRG